MRNRTRQERAPRCLPMKARRARRPWMLAVLTVSMTRKRAESEHPVADSDLKQSPYVADALPDTGLADAGTPLTEAEGDLASAESPPGEHDFEKYLETLGLQRLDVDRRAADQEEAAHRIGNPAQAPR